MPDYFNKAVPAIDILAMRNGAKASRDAAREIAAENREAAKLLAKHSPERLATEAVISNLKWIAEIHHAYYMKLRRALREAR